MGETLGTTGKRPLATVVSLAVLGFALPWVPLAAHTIAGPDGWWERHGATLMLLILVVGVLAVPFQTTRPFGLGVLIGTAGLIFALGVLFSLAFGGFFS